MKRFTSIQDLVQFKNDYNAVFGLREGGYRAKITVHMGPCGVAAGAEKVMAALLDETARANLKDVLVTTSSCGGLCAREPLATIEIRNEPPVKYGNLDETKIREIFREHILGGSPSERYALVLGCETTC